MTVSQGHRVAEAVRHRLVHDIARLDTAVIHVNPCGHDGEDRTPTFAITTDPSGRHARLRGHLPLSPGVAGVRPRATDDPPAARGHRDSSAVLAARSVPAAASRG